MAASINNDIMNTRNKGFTLIELQIAATIALITLSAVLALYLFSWRSFAIDNTLLDVYSNSRNAFGWLTRDVRCAVQIVSGYDSYITTDNSIVLMVKSIDVNGEVISPNCDYIIYELHDAAQGKDLYRIVKTDASSSRAEESRVIAHYCDSLAFSSLYDPDGSGGEEGEMKGLSFYDGTTPERMLSTINTVSIFLPINKYTASLSGTGTQTALINPTTMVRMRNK